MDKDFASFRYFKMFKNEYSTGLSNELSMIISWPIYRDYNETEDRKYFKTRDFREVNLDC